MKNEFSLAPGYEIDDVSAILQGYHISGNNITISINFEKIFKLVYDCIQVLGESVFFFIEIPNQENNDEQENDSSDIKFYKDIYYLDNCTLEVAVAIMKRYGDLLINDGIVQFGFGSHINNDEIYIKKYNLINIYATDPNKYKSILDKNEILELNNLITAWDVINENNPGRMTSVDFNSETIYTVIDNLTDAGLYYSHTTEDN